MSDGSVVYDPVNDQWSLSDGEHFLTVPHWARLSLADAYEREVAPLKAENAALFALLKHESEQTEKLRDLVGDMWDWLAPTAIGGDAPLQRIAARMRELGIEVD